MNGSATEARPEAAATPPDCLLTLALPRALEEEVLDTLMSHPEFARGFTVLHGQGGYTAEPSEVLLSVVSNRQLPRLKQLARAAGIETAEIVTPASIAARTSR